MARKLWRDEIVSFLGKISETQGNLAEQAGISRKSLTRYLQAERTPDAATQQKVNDAMAELSGLPAVGRYLQIVSDGETQPTAPPASILETVIHDYLESLSEFVDGGLMKADYQSWLRAKVGNWDNAKTKRFLDSILGFYRQSIILRIRGEVPKENEIDEFFAIFKREGLPLTAQVNKSKISLVRSANEIRHTVIEALHHVSEDYESIQTRMTEGQKILNAIGDLIEELEKSDQRSELERIKQGMFMTIAMFESFDKKEQNNERKGALLGEFAKLIRDEAEDHVSKALAEMTAVK